jgi:hypothetical protein
MSITLDVHGDRGGPLINGPRIVHLPSYTLRLENKRLVWPDGKIHDTELKATYKLTFHPQSDLVVMSNRISSYLSGPDTFVVARWNVEKNQLECREIPNMKSYRICSVSCEGDRALLYCVPAVGGAPHVRTVALTQDISMEMLSIHHANGVWKQDNVVWSTVPVTEATCMVIQEEPDVGVHRHLFLSNDAGFIRVDKHPMLVTDGTNTIYQKKDHVFFNDQPLLTVTETAIFCLDEQIYETSYNPYPTRRESYIRSVSKNMVLILLSTGLEWFFMIIGLVDGVPHRIPVFDPVDPDSMETALEPLSWYSYLVTMTHPNDVYGPYIATVFDYTWKNQGGVPLIFDTPEIQRNVMAQGAKSGAALQGAKRNRQEGLLTGYWESSG